MTLIPLLQPLHTSSFTYMGWHEPMYAMSLVCNTRLLFLYL